MSKLATVIIKLKSSGDIMVINEEDFNKDIHIKIPPQRIPKTSTTVKKVKLTEESKKAITS